MQIQQRDVRRRRDLSDEAAGAAALGEVAATVVRRIDRPTGKSPRRYKETALMDDQPRITDLAPKRLSTLALIFAAGLLLIASLEALYYWMPALSKNATDGRIAAFDLDDEGTLAAWFSSTLLSAAGLAALLVYYVRRLRLDDYVGNYRVWIWAALCWFGMSIDETGSLHEGFKELMSQATGHRLYGDGSIWWVGMYLLVLGVVGTQLLLEMRQHIGSTALLVLAGVCFAVAVVAQLDWLLPESGARGVMIEEGCEMAGDLLLLLAMLAHARYVIQDAGGELPVKTAKPKKARKPAEAADGKSVVAKAEAKPTAKLESAPKRAVEPAKRPVEPVRPVETKKPVEAKKPAPVTPATSASGNKLRVDRPEATEDHNKLSKAERKALRRQQQEDRGERYR